MGTGFSAGIEIPNAYCDPSRVCPQVRGQEGTCRGWVGEPESALRGGYTGVCTGQVGVIQGPVDTIKWQVDVFRGLVQGALDTLASCP
jgi:hypothetical protein